MPREYERKIIIRSGGTEFRWEEQDWLGLIVFGVLVLGAVFLYLGRSLEAVAVFSFGGGYSLNEIIVRARRKAEELSRGGARARRRKEVRRKW